MYSLVPRRGNLVRRGNSYDAFNMMNSFFNNSFFDSAPSVAKMKSDIRQTDNEYIIESELPGFDKSDIKLELKNSYLTITAGKDEKAEENENGYLRRERRTGQVCRSFYVEGIDQKDISAKYDNGVLAVTLPKKQKEEEPENLIKIT